MARSLGYTVPDGGRTPFWRKQVEAVVQYWHGKRRRGGRLRPRPGPRLPGAGDGEPLPFPAADRL